jgi:UDPglucose 6-dehydrogenase
MKITVFGAGYVGLVTAVCLAEMGNSIMGVDTNSQRVAGLQRGELPFHEPGLAQMLLRNVASHRLSFTEDVASAVRHATLVFIAVGTPSTSDGHADIGQVLVTARDVADHMDDYKVLVVKSTVPVSTAKRVREAIVAGLAARQVVVPFSVVSNPEFLKEGAAVNDFMRPDRVVIGCEDERAELLMRSLYAPFLRNRDRILVMNLASAELTKYAANAMLATRISFMNELAALSEQVDADIEQVRRGIGSDERIGTHFLYAGCGWGGSCFPKDVRALTAMAADAGVDLPIVRATLQVNERQRSVLAQRVVQRFGPDLSGLTIAVWGLAFKPETDDMREAPSVTIVSELLRAGASVRAYDPLARPAVEPLWGAGARVELAADALMAARDASALLLVTEWREFRSPDFVALRNAMRLPVLIDGRNLYDPALMAEAGFEYAGVGRASSVQHWQSEALAA